MNRPIYGDACCDQKRTLCPILAKSIIAFFFQELPEDQKPAPLPQTLISPICKIRRALIFLRKCTRKEIFSCVRKTRSQNRNRIFFTIFGAFRLVVPARLPSPTRKKTSFFCPSHGQIFGPSNLRTASISHQLHRNVTCLSLEILFASI